jgi:hypothetical protein
MIKLGQIDQKIKQNAIFVKVVARFTLAQAHQPKGRSEEESLLSVVVPV